MSPATDQGRPRNTHCPPYHGWCHPVLSHTLPCSVPHTTLYVPRHTVVQSVLCTVPNATLFHDIQFHEYSLPYSISHCSLICALNTLLTPSLSSSIPLSSKPYCMTIQPIHIIQYNTMTIQPKHLTKYNTMTNASNTIQPEPSMFGIWHQIRVTGSPAFFSCKTLASQNAADDSFCFNFYNFNHFNQCLSKCC